jgi:NTE family protein
MKLFKKKKRVLALGGGAARGLSNIGILKVFERHFGERNLPFDMMIGSSIGSMVGAAYCAGISLDEIESKALQFNWRELVDIGFNPTGLLRGDKLEDLIGEMLGESTFESLKIPFALTTTDIQTGAENVHTSGNLVRLIRASSSWAGFFSSVEIEGKMLADGGIRNSVPTKAAYNAGATFVVALNPGFAVKGQVIDNALKALVQTIQIMGEELNFYQSCMADMSIKPSMQGVDQFDFDQAAFIIKAGELAAERSMPELKKKLFLHKMF